MPESVLDKFLRYIKIDTQSKEGEEDIPSTKKQFDLARVLVTELRQMGIEDAEVDDHCYVYATLPANVPESVDPCSIPVVGLIAHMDTSPEAPGANVEPIIWDYEGGEIVLPGDKTKVISPKENPILDQCKGLKIVTSDGTTLLGADDKAGIAEIMTAVETLLNDKSVYHGKVRIGFTPDEEVGRGVDLFRVDKFGAKVAYTLDGSTLGEIENETFNASWAHFRIKGYNVHPGYAKDLMINSIKIMNEIIAEVGAQPSPENTEGKEGYLHVHTIKGTVEESEMKVLIRDHDTGKTEEKKQYLQKVRDDIAAKHPKAQIILEIKDSYQNMKVVLDENPQAVDNALEAVRRVGIEPLLHSIRGGTDGARLCFMGLPTPNVFAGGHNFHGKKEFVAVQHMEKSVDVAIEILKLYYEQATS